MQYAARRKKVTELLIEQKLDALLLFGLPMIRYFCGFTGTDGVLLLSQNQSTFLTDSRYQTQSAQEVTAEKKICYSNKLKHIVEEIRAQGYQRVGFDSASLTVAVFDEIKLISGDTIEWFPLGEPLRTIRSSKDSDELVPLKQAAQLNQKAFEQVLPSIKPGVSERTIALELECALKKLGGECNAFDFIVASGARGALPHGVASDKLLQAGELVTIDFGTRVDGYHSDETVTLAIGPVDGKLRQIFDIVLKAHDLALAAVQPGIELRDLDAVARDYIRKQGYGDYFGHGLGHGVGLEIHEYPALSPRADAQAVEGMVVTIEPGIYIPELGGVRIEDTVVVTADGYEALTSIPKEFYQIDVP
ncbi:Xaa-Pro aminopeptidase [Malonomonas rubra DSM 5091]|uniref:Xaa-Pro aminopeptidase n=1 Tax=Malonomonas rubra DSM 5091 TaxID=1122189 RepID=A0A1M6LJ36_MALRU|nr:aminopeptidase P family protein [Malonomonas rubra]SHJ71180.1 Xaa-Pro aminopeptidase [Malonomonas rubra DSM 5091]